jgi:hypothetical protein
MSSCCDVCIPEKQLFFSRAAEEQKTPPCPQNAGIGCFSLNNTFFGNYSIKTTMNQYYYGKNSKNLICFSIKNVPGASPPPPGHPP